MHFGELDYSAIRTDAYALNGSARHYLHCASLTLDSSHLIWPLESL
jgi:hypothetical protein